ncbi:MAG: HTTM domain-containing protein [Verrucomicrobiales bacterium]|nr:HTTM domain-containing protein [Verrucomicrobiales bacterium]
MSNLLFRPVASYSLALFRIFWGVLLFGTAVSSYDQITGVYSPDYFHFRYFGFEWVPYPETELDTFVELSILLGLAIGVASGFFTRLCLVLYAVIYLHLFLIDQVYYNNHFYLTILICVCLSLTDSGNVASVTNLLFKKRKPLHFVPSWQYWVLRFQIVLVYLFGGLAKLNSDWLRGEPLRYWLNYSSSIKWPLQALAKEEWFVYVCAYGGIAIDLICPVFLLFRKTRWVGAIVLISFHILNSRLFNIGLFPLIGLVLLIPFFENQKAFRAVYSWMVPNSSGESRDDLSLASRPFILPVLAIYVSIQILGPLRHHFLRLDPAWTEVGRFFSWRMMLRNKDSYLDFLIDSSEAREWISNNAGRLPKLHSNHLISLQENPWFLLQYVRKLDEVLSSHGMTNVPIRAVCLVSLNHRPYQVLIDPSVDLTEVEYSILKEPDWILPLNRSLSQTVKPLSREDRLKSLQSAIDKFREQNPEKSILLNGYQAKTGG